MSERVILARLFDPAGCSNPDSPAWDTVRGAWAAQGARTVSTIVERPSAPVPSVPPATATPRVGWLDRLLSCFGLKRV